MQVPFRTRILVSAVVTALIAVVVLWATVSLVIDQVVAPPDFGVPPQLLDACRQDPEHWSELPFGSGRMRLYDAAGRAPDGEVLAPEHVALPVGASERVAGGGRPSLVRRVASDGPCALVRVEFGPPPRWDSAVPLGGALGLFLSVLAVGLATHRFTLVPLLARIERLRGAADGVGATGYRSADDPTDDDLGAIGAVLDASHQRITGDRAELVRRHEALERHLAEIAHDLRTPLGSMMLALQEVGALVEDGDARTATRRALSDVGYVTTLVENLHQAARLRHGLDPVAGETDLAEVVRRIEARFRALGAARGVEVGASAPDTPVIVRCEPSLLERAVANLVHNGLAHGAAHVALLLDVDGDGFVLQVLDDGPGVEPTRLADLSARTFTDDAARQRGPGLGLAITNEVVRRVGWHIAYARAEEGGLSVTVRGARLP